MLKFHIKLVHVDDSLIYCDLPLIFQPFSFSHLRPPKVWYGGLPDNIMKVDQKCAYFMGHAVLQVNL